MSTLGLDASFINESKSDGELAQLCRWDGVVLRTTKRGRPFQKDLCEAFVEAMRSVPLRPHLSRNLLGMSKPIDNTFTLDELADELLKVFPQTDRPKANILAQHFLDSRYIENAKNPDNNIATDGSLFTLTPKGLHLLEHAFVNDSSQITRLGPVFASQSVCSKVLHLERNEVDDEISWSYPTICALFRRFSGTQPNYYDPTSKSLDDFQRYYQHSRGVPLYIAGNDVPVEVRDNCFSAVTLLAWLCDFATFGGREEAAEAGAHFVRHGLISLVSDKRKGNNSAIIFTVRGPLLEGHPEITAQGEFRCTQKAVYRLTKEGLKIANWQLRGGGHNILPYAMNNEHKVDETVGSMSRSTSNSSEFTSPPSGQILVRNKDTPETVWKRILEDSFMRSLFEEFLEKNLARGILSFWFDVEALREKVNGTDQYGNWIIPQGSKGEEFFTKLAEIREQYLGGERCANLPVSSATFNELAGCIMRTLRIPELQTSPSVSIGLDLLREDPSSKLTEPLEFLLTRAQKEVLAHILKWVPQFMRTSHYIGARRRSQSKPSLTHTRPASETSLRSPEAVTGAHITYSQRGLQQEQRAPESLKALEVLEAARLDGFVGIKRKDDN